MDWPAERVCRSCTSLGISQPASSTDNLTTHHTTICTPNHIHCMYVHTLHENVCTFACTYIVVQPGKIAMQIDAHWGTPTTGGTHALVKTNILGSMSEACATREVKTDPPIGPQEKPNEIEYRPICTPVTCCQSSWHDLCTVQEIPVGQLANF